MYRSGWSLPGDSCRRRPGGQPAVAGKPAPVAAKAAAVDAQQARPLTWKKHGQAGAATAGFDTDTAVGGRTAFSLLGVGCLLAALPATGASPQPSLVLLAYAAVGIVALFPVTPGRLGSPLLPAAPGTRGA